jgi:DnaJ-domain-containing protein 1
MIDRIKNILKAELYDYVDKFSPLKGSNFDPEVEEILRRFHQQEKEKRQAPGGGQHQQQQSAATNKEQEYYTWLELAYGSPFDEIKKSYRKLMKLYHPDLFHGDQEKFTMAQEVSSKLNEAYVYFEKKFGK